MDDSHQAHLPKLRALPTPTTPPKIMRLLRLPQRAFRLWRNKGVGTLFQRVGQRFGKMATRLGWRRTKKHDYQDWLGGCELTGAQIEQDRADVSLLVYRPLLSFITPVYNPPADVFRAMLESIQAQTYDKWEICLANGDPSNQTIRAICDEYAATDKRMRVTHLSENLGISGNSNEALRMAQGEFLCFMDHDDMMPPVALGEIVRRLNEKPMTDLIYFDEDLVSGDGKHRHSPFFKPDWSPELFLSANFLSHAVVRRSLVEKVGRFDATMDGAQDWDLFLRCTEHTKLIEHIPKVLYHWRQISGSCAGLGSSPKPYARENQLRAVKNHLARRGFPNPITYFYRPEIVRCHWQTTGKKVSIVIPTKDNVDLLKQCVHSIFAVTDYPSFEIVIVDSGSKEPETLEYYGKLKSKENIRIVDFAGPFNYSAANNLGAKHATGDLLLFLNNDTEVMYFDWLDELVRWAEQPNVGAVGTKLLYADDHVQHAGVVVGMEGHASHVFLSSPKDHSDWFGSVDWYRNYLAVTGACVMMRREVFDEIGGFDEKYTLVFSDVEICLRAVERGYRNVYTPFAEMRHYEGQSRGHSLPLPDCQRAAEQFRFWIEHGDPYYNPNLSYRRHMPTLRPKDEETRSNRLDRIMNDMAKAA